MSFQQRIDKKQCRSCSVKKISTPLKSIEIHSEAFTSLIEFVKNYLVKIEFLCHYQKPYLRDLNGTKLLSSVNRIAKYL